MDNRPVVILGSARRDGDSNELLEVLFPGSAVKIISLLDYQVNQYSYSGSYPPDEQFLQLVNGILPHQKLIFATLVYWYAMSGGLKIFFDRLTDLMTIRKDLGRQMAGKENFLVAVGAEEELPPGFEVPFQLTSSYFGMMYKACYYCSTKALHISTESRIKFVGAVNLT